VTPFMIGFWAALGALCGIAVALAWSLVAFGVIVSLARSSEAGERR